VTKPIYLKVNIPFSGFYESIWSQEVDECERREVEYRQDDWGGFNGDIANELPEELRPDGDKLAEIYMDCSDYSAAYQVIARDYESSFWHIVSQELPRPVTHKFDRMISPREYNFRTDEIDSYVRLSDIRLIYSAMIETEESRKILADAIKARHTSYDGFISFYDNNPANWLAKPIRDWDLHECGTLVRAFVAYKLADDLQDHGDSLDMLIYGKCDSNEEIYRAWSDCVNWDKVSAQIEEHAAEKLALLMEENPDYARCIVDNSSAVASLVPDALGNIDASARECWENYLKVYADSHYRCPLTLEMFPETLK